MVMALPVATVVRIVGNVAEQTSFVQQAIHAIHAVPTTTPHQNDDDQHAVTPLSLIVHTPDGVDAAATPITNADRPLFYEPVAQSGFYAPTVAAQTPQRQRAYRNVGR